MHGNLWCQPHQLQHTMEPTRGPTSNQKDPKHRSTPTLKWQIPLRARTTRSLIRSEQALFRSLTLGHPSTINTLLLITKSMELILDLQRNKASGLQIDLPDVLYNLGGR